MSERNTSQILRLESDFLRIPTYRLWIPTVTQGVSVTSTPSPAKYVSLGRFVQIMAEINITSAGTGGSGIVIGGIPLPLAAGYVMAGLTPAGTVTVFDNGTAVYFGFANWITSTTLGIYDSNTRGQIGANPSFALANTDIISINITYEQ